MNTQLPSLDNLHRSSRGCLFRKGSVNLWMTVNCYLSVFFLREMTQMVGWLTLPDHNSIGDVLSANTSVSTHVYVSRV